MKNNYPKIAYSDYIPDPERIRVEQPSIITQDFPWPGIIKAKKREHDLTVTPEQYQGIVDKKLSFLLCKDEGQHEGDLIHLREFKNGRTGRRYWCEVTYKETGKGLKKGMVILSVKNIPVRVAKKTIR